MSRKKVQQGRRVNRGPLAGHYRTGQRYKPSIMALPGTLMNDWARDDLPDLLWPLMLVAEDGDAAAVAFRRFQEVVLRSVDSSTESPEFSCDGRLTSLERFPPYLRTQLLADFVGRTDASLLFAPSILGVFRLYPSIPGSWLLVEPWKSSKCPSEEESLNFLAGSIVKVLSDRHLNALTKTPPFGWLVLKQKIHLPHDLIDLLIDYPTNPSKRSAADAIILSSFLTFKMTDEAQDSGSKLERLDWARKFWDQNRRLTACMPAADPEDDEPEDLGDDSSGRDEDAHDEGAEAGVSVSEVIKNYLSEVDEIFADFTDAFFDPSGEIDLLNPSRSEVLAGIATRAVRSTVALILAPHMWTGEQGSAQLRALFEAAVTLKWLMLQGDDEVFERFQAYGLGKRKLQAKHTQDLATRFETGSDESNFVNRLAEQLEQKGGGEVADQFTEVNLEATFSGLSLRAMADQVDELDRYNTVFQMASKFLTWP